jgi:putative transcriptional regulator
MKSLWGLAIAVMLVAGIGLEPQRHTAAQEEHNYIGMFLVAAPTMGDPRFEESVVYMVGHGEDGAIGLVINRPVAEGPLADLLKALGSEGEDAKGNVTIHYGGPVEPEQFFVLHSNDYASKATRFVGNGLGVTSDPEILQAIAQGKGPRQKLLIFGYAGWGPGQLEAELKDNAWFVIPADMSILFDTEPEKKWERALAKRKVKA